MWRSVRELVQIGFQRSPIVMMNEAHDYMHRCRRTQIVGKEILADAFEQGARILAMEALSEQVATELNRSRKIKELEDHTAHYGYLRHKEMRALINHALEIGFTLAAHEAFPEDDKLDFFELAVLRDRQQAENLAKAIPPGGRALVWAGNHHIAKVPLQTPDEKIYPQMAYNFWKLTGIEPFSIDQACTVEFKHRAGRGTELANLFRRDIERFGRSAGFLRDEPPAGFAMEDREGFDAFILSLDNEMDDGE